MIVPFKLYKSNTGLILLSLSSVGKSATSFVGVSIVDKFYKIGYKSNNWRSSSFSLFNGKIELEVNNKDVILDNEGRLYLNFKGECDVGYDDARYSDTVTVLCKNNKKDPYNFKVNRYLRNRLSRKEKLSFSESIGKKIILKNKI